MHEVRPVPFRAPCATRLWFSERAAKEVARFRRKGDPDGAFWKRLERICQSGFGNYENLAAAIVRHEWDGVYRVGFIDSLFRLVGFYKDASKRDFIVIDCFLKKGQSLTRPQCERIDEVARIRKEGLWKEAQSDEFPRLAQ